MSIRKDTIRKSIDRALPIVLDEWMKGHFDGSNAAIADRAVLLAELRRGRSYPNDLQRYAYEYALSQVK